MITRSGLQDALAVLVGGMEDVIADKSLVYVAIAFHVAGGRCELVSSKGDVPCLSAAFERAARWLETAPVFYLCKDARPGERRVRCVRSLPVLSDKARRTLNSLGHGLHDILNEDPRDKGKLAFILMAFPEDGELCELVTDAWDLAASVFRIQIDKFAEMGIAAGCA